MITLLLFIIFLGILFTVLPAVALIYLIIGVIVLIAKLVWGITKLLLPVLGTVFVILLLVGLLAV